MDKIKRFIWNIGMVPGRTTFIILGIVLMSFLAIIICGVLLAITHASLFKVIIIIAAIPPSIIALGSSNRALSWTLSSKEERVRIEKDMSVHLLRSWLRTDAAEKKTRR